MSKEKLSLKQFAYQAIKEKIINCEYVPNSFLKEDQLCEEFGISRTPVRDALGRLEQEHLIKILPKKGFLVSPLSTQEINMVYEGRILLESYILENYCQDLPEKVLDRMSELQEKYYQCIIQHIDDIHVVDDAFHSSIISQCENRYFLHILDEMDNQNCRLRVLSGRMSDKRLFASYNEHQLILDNLAKNRLPEAVEALKEHLINSKKAAFQAFLYKSGTL